MGFLVQGGAPPNDSVTGAKLSPSLVTGDIIYSDGVDTITRLAKGTDGNVLTQASGLPSWASPASGSTLLIKNSSGTTLKTINGVSA